MTILTKADKINYLSKQQKINTIKYGNGVSRNGQSPNFAFSSGEALYLPKLRYGQGPAFTYGDGILDTIGSFLINNKDTINAIANTVGSVSDSIGKVAGTTIDIVKKARELRNQGLSNETAEKILRERSSESGLSNKSGSGFYYIDK